MQADNSKENNPRHPPSQTPTPKDKKQKVYYQDRKDAATKLNFLQRNPHSKKLPVRVYQDESGWHLTKLKLIDEMPLLDLIEMALKYSDGKKYGKGRIYKREWEEEKRLRDAIYKTILNIGILPQ